MNKPRTKSGGRYHPYGTEVHAVVLNEDGDEISERHTGRLWIALTPSGPSVRMDALFMDDRGSSTSTFVITKAARVLRACIVVDGEHAMDAWASSGYYAKGCSLNMDWTSMFSEMA